MSNRGCLSDREFIFYGFLEGSDPTESILWTFMFVFADLRVLSGILALQTRCFGIRPVPKDTRDLIDTPIMLRKRPRNETLRKPVHLQFGFERQVAMRYIL